MLADVSTTGSVASSEVDFGICSSLLCTMFAAPDEAKLWIKKTSKIVIMSIIG